MTKFSVSSTVRRAVTAASLAVGMSASFGFAAEGRPAPSNVPGRDFPKIHDDLRVTFRAKAPDAHQVQLARAATTMGSAAARSTCSGTPSASGR